MLWLIDYVGSCSSNAIRPERHVIEKVTNLWCDLKVKFLSNDYTNPKILMTLTLTLTNPHNVFERFCATVFCDIIRSYLGTPSHFDIKKCIHR